jgi:hypothetical protein
VRAALVSLAGTNHIASLPVAMSPAQQIVLGRLNVAALDVPDSAELVLAVIDRRTNQVTRTMYSTDSRLGSGWDGTMNKVADRYPWLSSFRDGPGGIVNQTAVEWRAGKPRDVTFYAVLDGDEPPVSSLSDVRVVLVLTGPDGQVWGAERLS